MSLSHDVAAAEYSTESQKFVKFLVEIDVTVFVNFFLHHCKSLSHVENTIVLPLLLSTLRESFASRKRMRTIAHQNKENLEIVKKTHVHVFRKAFVQSFVRRTGRMTQMRWFYFE